MKSPKIPLSQAQESLQILRDVETFTSQNVGSEDNDDSSSLTSVSDTVNSASRSEQNFISPRGQYSDALVPQEIPKAEKPAKDVDKTQPIFETLRRKYKYLLETDNARDAAEAQFDRDAEVSSIYRHYIRECNTLEKAEIMVRETETSLATAKAFTCTQIVQQGEALLLVTRENLEVARQKHYVAERNWIRVQNKKRDSWNKFIDLYKLSEDIKTEIKNELGALIDGKSDLLKFAPSDSRGAQKRKATEMS